MKKFERMEQMVRDLAAGQNSDLPPEYTGFFVCFNRGEYYEAHDVLEHLWLRSSGPERDFFQGLILLAGGFVHLRKNYLRPLHFKDGRRLPAARRLFQLSETRLAAFPEIYWRLNLRMVRELIRQTSADIGSSGLPRNPWRPETAPRLALMDSP